MSAKQYLKEFTDFYFEEQKSTEDIFVLPISSTCASSCLFCSNENNPFEITRCGYRPFDEIRKVLWNVDHIKGPIVLNYGVSTLSEGEPVLHPEIIKICKFLRAKYPNNLIQISTNGVGLTKEKLDALNEIGFIMLPISMHCVDRENWKRIFKMKDKHYDIAINSIEYIERHCPNLEYEPRIVAMPEIVGYDGLEDTVKFFEERYKIRNRTRRTCFVTPKYTKYNTEEVQKALYVDENKLHEFIKYLRKKYKSPISWFSEPGGAIDFADDLLFQLRRVQELKPERVFLFTSTGAGDYLQDYIAKTDTELKFKKIIVKVPNYEYGGNIDAAALWMLSDIEKQIEMMQLENEIILLPKMFLDKYGYDLTGRNVYDMLDNNSNKFIFIEEQKTYKKRFLKLGDDEPASATR